MVEKFIAELQRQGVSKNTLDGYLFDIIQFKDWLKINELDNQITKKKLFEYKVFLTSNYSENTVLRKIKSVIRFNNFLYHFGESTLKVEPKEIHKIRKNKVATRILEFNDFVRIREIILESQNKKDILIFHLLVGTGCRVSELINIEIDDFKIINAFQGFIRIKNFKSSRFSTFREIGITEALIGIINDYLEVRPVTKSNILLVGQKGPLTRYTINKLFRKYSLMANIKYTVSPNMIRKLVILYMVNELQKRESNILTHTIHPLTKPSTLKYFEEKYFGSKRNIDIETITRFINQVSGDEEIK